MSIKRPPKGALAVVAKYDLGQTVWGCDFDAMHHSLKEIFSLKIDELTFFLTGSVAYGGWHWDSHGYCKRTNVGEEGLFDSFEAAAKHAEQEIKKWNNQRLKEAKGIIEEAKKKAEEKNEQGPKDK